MSTQFKFTAFDRALQGTGASRRLRVSGRVPAIVYGGTSVPALVELDHNEIWHALRKEAFHATVLKMDINGTATDVLLRSVQYHPFKQQVLHIDFQRVEAGCKMVMRVPLHFSGEEHSSAVKAENCIANRIVNEVRISCLPADLPEFIAVDLSGLKKGASLHLSDLVLPSGVSAIINGKYDPVVVAVVALAAPEVVEAAPVAAKGKAPAKKK